MGIENRGFASMTPERRLEIATRGGLNAKGRHRWTKSEAKRAGKLGVIARRKAKNKPKDIA